MIAFKQQLIIFAFLAICAADSFGQAIKCIDQKGRVVYSNIQCPDNTRLEKLVGSPSVINSHASPPPSPNQNTSDQMISESSRNLSTSSTGTTIYCQAGSYASIDNRGNKICKSFPTSSLPKSRYFSDPFSSLTPTEAETQAKLEELQSQQEQLKLEQDDAQVAADEAMEEAKDRAEQARQESEDRAKEVADAAEAEAADLRGKILRAEIGRSNNLYLGGFLLLVGLGSFYVIKKNKRGGIMNANQKYGIAIIVLSIFMMILALVVSDGWENNLDFLGNLMQSLKIQFIVIKGDCEIKINCTHDHYFIDIPTKYVVLAFISTAAYGLTTYLSITPAFMPWKKASVK